jgi:hypothetical protein
LKKNLEVDLVQFGGENAKLEWFKFCPNCGRPLKPGVMFQLYFTQQGDTIPFKNFDHLCKNCRIMYMRQVLMTEEEYDYIKDTKTFVIGDRISISTYKQFKEKVKLKYGRRRKSNKSS